MKNVKIVDLMTIERLLLEINLRYKFDLDFCEAYSLHSYLTSVGKITSYFFLIQEEFHNKYNDKELLKEYHDKLINGHVKFEVDGIIEFIEGITDKYGNDEFKELVGKLMFWDKK